MVFFASGGLETKSYHGLGLLSYHHTFGNSFFLIGEIRKKYDLKWIAYVSIFQRKPMKKEMFSWQIWVIMRYLTHLINIGTKVKTYICCYFKSPPFFDEILKSYVICTVLNSNKNKKLIFKKAFWYLKV